MLDMMPTLLQRREPERPEPYDPRSTLGRAAYPATDDEDEAVYAKYTREFVEDQQASREPLHRTWQQNILFLAGHQHLEFDALLGSFNLPRQPDWKERPVVNLLRPYFKHWLAKVTKEHPVLVAVPASNDADDVQAALLADDVLKAKWQERKGPRKLRAALAWVFTCGNVGIMPYWNDDTGKIIPLTTPVQAGVFDPETGAQVGAEIVECPCDENGAPIMDEMGNYDLEAEPHYVDEGDLDYKAISPFHIYFNEDAEDASEIRELVIIDPMTPTEFYDRFPDAPEAIPPDDDGGIDDLSDLLRGLTAGIGGPDTYFTGLQTDEEGQGRIRVYHYFGRPTTTFPNGRHWVTAGTFLVVEPEPLPDELWPQFVFMRDIEVPGQIWAAATMTDAVGLQREYNDINAFIKEHHNLLLRGKWLVPIGSNIRRGQITSEPGEVIQHTPGLPPKQAQIEPLPDPVYQERKRIMEDFQLVSGLFKISMGGSPPPGVTSGRAFLTMQEADDTDFGPFLYSMEDDMAELGSLSLRIIQKRYDEERLIEVVGANRRYRVRSFKGADLAGVSTVVPQRGSSFPWSQVAKQDMLMQAARDVPMLFVNPESGQFDVDRFRDLLPVGGIGSLMNAGDDDVEEALREQEKIEMWDGASPPPLPLPWQNHRVHLREHAKVLKSAAFEKWSPESRMLMVQHWEATQLEMMKLIAAMQPPPDEAGNGPPGAEKKPQGPPSGPPAGPPA
jgi:hypothetical protein